jgi:hypothetical protein
MIKLKFDTKLFDDGMIRAASGAISTSAAEMQATMERFKDDALNKFPACPIKTGWMADHHIVDVSVLGKKVVGSLAVVDTPYAASLHEGISRWGTPYKYKTPGTGMKWIASKMLLYHRTYLRDFLGRFTTHLKLLLQVVR